MIQTMESQHHLRLSNTSDGPPSFICSSLDELNQCYDNTSELTDDVLSQEDEYYNKDTHQDVIDLRLKIAKQQERLDILASKLTKCQDEKVILVEELAFFNLAQVAPPPAAQPKCFARRATIECGKGVPCSCLLTRMQS